MVGQAKIQLAFPMANSFRAAAADPNRNSPKRQKLTADRRRVTAEQSLIPGLPDHVSQLCLSFAQPSSLYSVCHSWRRLIYSPSFPPFLSLYAVLSSKHSHQSIQFCNFDPIAGDWDFLPPPTQGPPLSELLHCHPSFISRHLPVQTVSACGNLILLAATAHSFAPALSRPLVFNPLSAEWSSGPPLSAPRRWCAAGVASGAVYVASGIGSNFSAEVAKSVERWGLQAGAKPISASQNRCGGEMGARKWEWEKLRGLRDGRFCREAIEAVGWRGKLCMVNVKGAAAKEGVIYDVANDSWEEMPEGMMNGWRGPAATMDEEVMYVVDEAKGVLKNYNRSKDDWENVLESDKLRGAQQVAAGGGRVCVACGGGIVVVDVLASPVRLWTVEAPPGYDAMSVHVLPRMTKSAE